MKDLEFCQNIVIGSGAAGLNSADRLYEYGVRDILLITEGINSGTSRNTGSDKQTYYKLSLAGIDSDSVRELAADLFKGRAVDGDIALCEAALSVQGFMKLAELGVPFPHNRYGEYIGYKTDHDPHKRATSAGPYTSRYMTEVLEKEILKKNIRILDGYQAVKFLSTNNRIRGVVLVNRKNGQLKTVLCKNLIMATGGPAGIYKNSVYPESQFGATGLAFEIGVHGKNLTEWQYGLASVRPRWNVSGSYMQVLPRFVSIDQDGNEYDFLSSFFENRNEMLSLVFLKGYQWPFDVRKLENGSSIVDILCYLELEKGRKVYLDFIHNPDNKHIDIDMLSEEACEYLKKSGATGETPIERLCGMNEPAYLFYLDKGVDLKEEYLEISLSAQHNNGGLGINCWWESNISGLFPVGEVAGSHGVYRPGGSALNSGQVGSTRASQFVAFNCQDPEWNDHMDNDLMVQLEEIEGIIESSYSGTIMIDEDYGELKKKMSLKASVIRNKNDIEDVFNYVDDKINNFSNIKIDSPLKVWKLFEYRNALITSRMYLFAMLEYISSSGSSRGSSLYSCQNGSIQPKGLDSRFRYTLEENDGNSLIQEVWQDRHGLHSLAREARPIPSDDDFFEVVWAKYRENKSIY